MIALGARRTFRLAAVVALALAFAYGLAMPMPFLAPIFAVFLTATPAAPMGVKGLLGLLLVVTITLGTGLVLTPLLHTYPWSAVLMIAAGLYASTYLSVGLGKGLVSTLLTVGLTLIPAAGLVEHALARTMVTSLMLGIALAIACQWLVYPLFPEDPGKAAPKKPAVADPRQSAWIALRATLIVLPPVLMAFTNPSLYLAIIMKSVLLAQQGSVVSAGAAGRELLGSTFLAGAFAIAFWFALKLWPNLWMFFLWMLLFGIYFAGKLYGVFASRYTPSFWINVVVTMFILIGPAVQDSAGNDVYRAFAVRFCLFVAVTLYAWGAIVFLEWLRGARSARALRAT